MFDARFTTALTLTLFFIVNTAGTVSAAQPIANAGTLTCTVEPAADGGTDPTRDVSCQFQPIAGVPAEYSGTIKRVSGPPLTDANLVFIWTVLATKTEIPPRSLTGRYLSSLSDAEPPSAAKVGSLRRESVEPVELRTLTPAAETDETRSLIMELDLVKARA